MCLVFLSYHKNPEYPLIILANRDEFYDRPTSPAAFWQDHPTVLAGRDQLAGGTWMGINRYGNLALLTNYRDLSKIKANSPSRGELVANFLVAPFQVKSYLESLDLTAEKYNGFNLILGPVNDLWYYSNHRKKAIRLGSGTYGLSNALLDTPWPKVKVGKETLKAELAQPSLDEDNLFAIMGNRSLADEEDLPNTGLNLEKERAVSAMFIETNDYGTRCTTLLTVSRENNVRFVERTYLQDGSHDDTRFEFSLIGFEN